MNDTDTMSDADKVDETPMHTPQLDWIVYQIGGPDRHKFRFVIVQGFDDTAVEGQLSADEFIDTTTTLLGHLGGDVTVLQPDALAALSGLLVALTPCFDYTGVRLVVSPVDKAVINMAMQRARAVINNALGGK